MVSFGEWFFNFITVSLAIFFLSAILGIEFNEYPYDTIKINGTNCTIAFDDICFCPNWENGKYSWENKLTKINYSFSDEYCNDKSKREWINPTEKRITYDFGYEIILTRIYDTSRQVEIEIIDKHRAWVLIGGKGFP